MHEALLADLMFTPPGVWQARTRKRRTEMLLARKKRHTGHRRTIGCITDRHEWNVSGCSR